MRDKQKQLTKSLVRGGFPRRSWRRVIVTASNGGKNFVRPFSARYSQLGIRASSTLRRFGSCSRTTTVESGMRPVARSMGTGRQRAALSRYLSGRSWSDSSLRGSRTLENASSSRRDLSSRHRNATPCSGRRSHAASRAPHPGASWEGFALEQAIGACAEHVHSFTEHAGTELDLFVIETASGTASNQIRGHPVAHEIDAHGERGSRARRDVRRVPGRTRIAADRVSVVPLAELPALVVGRSSGEGLRRPRDATSRNAP